MLATLRESLSTISREMHMHALPTGSGMAHQISRFKLGGIRLRESDFSHACDEYTCMYVHYGSLQLHNTSTRYLSQIQQAILKLQIMVIS